MYLGEFSHNLDSKGRIFMPAKFREQLGEQFVLTRSIDACLCIYPTEKWQRLTEKIAALPELDSKKLARFLYPSACEVVPDSQGRFLIPVTLRQFAGLKKSITVIGMGDYVEIWNADGFTAQRNEESLDDIRALMRTVNF